MRVALYVRRSTIDLQPDSLEAQEELLRKHAKEHEQEVIRVYADSSSGRSVEGRGEFLQLIDDVKAGADFEAVLVRDVSRWSRAENTDEAGFYEFICRSNGVQVIYVDEIFGADTSPYSLLLKSVKRVMAAEYSLERSRQVKGAHARLVKLGFWPTGSVPFGLRRILVEPDGEVVREMLPGDRKALSSQRIKLAPGPEAEVATVRRIFTAYAVEEKSGERIAKELNADGVPGPKRGRWSTGMVMYFLRNEAYAGSLVYRFGNGSSRSDRMNTRDTPSDDIVRCESAHDPIVEKEIWTQTQTRLAAMSRRKSDAALLADLEAARERWGCVVLKETMTGTALREHNSARDISTIGDASELAKDSLQKKLSERFHVRRFEGGVLLDHLLHIGFKVSLPHAQFGGLQWDFQFSGDEQEDVILGLGFSPPPGPQHVETFLFRMAPFRKGRRHVRPRIDSADDPVYSRFPADAPPVDLLLHAIRYRGTRAEKELLRILRGREKVNLKQVASELAWPARSVRTLYRKLEIRGEVLPALRNGTPAKRLTVTCPHCRRDRSLSATTVLSLRTDVCFECLHRPPQLTPNKLVAECPLCGARRLLYPSEVASRSSGLETPCRKCTMARGRAAGRAASHGRKQ